MNFLDILALAIIAISVFGAISKGMIVELISLGSVILGFFAASFGYDYFDTFFLGVAKPPKSAFLAFIAIFVVVIVVGSIVGIVVNRMLKTLHLKWLDRILGGAFGLVRGWLVVSIIFLGFAAFSVQRENMAQSRTAGFFLQSARLIVVLVPQELKSRFAEGYHKAYRLWIEQKS